MGTGTLYRWVKDVSTTDNIKNDNFYSNRSAIGDIDVEENGIYSVRISTSITITMKCGKKEAKIIIKVKK